MALVGDALHHGRVPLGHPTKNKKRATDFCPLTDGQNFVGTALNQRWKSGPQLRIFNRLNFNHVKPILDIEGKGMQKWGGGRVHG
jgi:hypothetical protein